MPSCTVMADPLCPRETIAFVNNEEEEEEEKEVEKKEMDDDDEEEEGDSRKQRRMKVKRIGKSKEGRN
ncbi:hypothetical protein E2C01_100394 [Portunus trituberculatus]|uniref:Uncharacterized protein n=1 Tax=Portunus trituberculatus TaxID=210409 RepID=A0A5B7K6U9_PORTR|nr:hypothetical protein [Portunus trituberculatus]